MQRLKITLKLKSNPVITNDIYFDGIIYYLMRKQQLGADYYNLPRFKKIQLEKIELSKVIKRQKNVYLASKMCYKLKKEFTNRWRKRWNENSAEKWVEKKRIYINQKKTKNYDMPIKVSILRDNECWFYCVGDKKKLSELLQELIGIGKEINQGYGLIESFKIEETNHKGVRLFPVFNETKLNKNDIIKVSRYNPPYSSGKIKKCVYRKF